MKHKLTILLSGLLLAVGWTGDASAQLKAPRDISSMKMATVKKTVNQQTPRLDEMTEEARPSRGEMLNAPHRSQNFSVTSPAVRSKAQFDAMGRLSWTDLNGAPQSTLLTEPYTDANGMMALVREIYTNRNIPGIKYSSPWDCDVPYQTIQYGWNIIGTIYNEPIKVKISSSDVRLLMVRVLDPNGNTLTEWWASGTSANLPQGWSASPSLRSSIWYDSNGDGYYSFYQDGGGTITIPRTYFSNSYGYVEVQVAAVTVASEPSESNSKIEAGNETFNYGGYILTNEDIYIYELFDLPGTITPPDDAGYTVMLVKLRDDVDFSNRPINTASEDELRSYFQTYVKEIQLLPDGYRVGSGESAGTLFSYSGDLNRFYFISKGKMLYLSSLDILKNTGGVDLAPFYSMYEEFSPTTMDVGSEITDFYSRMQNNESYPIVHDCRSVIVQEHYFSMAGKEGKAEHEVNSLVFFIPDYRGGTFDDWRNYNTDHQPRTGLYVIDITPTVQPTASTDFYNVHVTWDSNLDDISGGADVPQTYYLYAVYPDGTVEPLTPNGTTNTYFDHTNVPAGDPDAYPIGYYVIGNPTGCTNPDFVARSKTKSVTIPGKDDFIGLTLVRHESDYMPNVNKNYYRNFLYPMNLEALGEHGVTKGYVGTQGRSLVLKRDGQPIIELELVMDGTKAYYRFKNVAADKDVEPGYNEETGVKEQTTNPTNN